MDASDAIITAGARGRLGRACGACSSAATLLRELYLGTPT